MFRTGNPTLKDTTFTRASTLSDGVMTLQGTVNKTGILLMILLATAAVSWRIAPGAGLLMPFMLGGAISGLILSIATVVRPAWSPLTAPLYAAAEGLFLGSVSLIFNARYPGIAVNAASLTLAILASLLLAYRSGLIHASENFKLGVVAATGGIGIVYLVSLGMSLFGMHVPYIHESGLVGLGFSLFVVALASANLVLDFDFIEKGAERRAPKHMEWYGAFALVVTLVWLYVELLRLLAKLQDRRR